MEITPQPKLYTLSEATKLLPLVKKITGAQREALEPWQTKLDRMLSNDPRRPVIEREYERLVSAWRGKIGRVGARAAGLWVVEFDVGDGVLSWRYPELQIAHFVAESDTIRRRLSDYIEENDPDWAL